MIAPLRQLWEAALQRPLVSLCIVLTLALAPANYRLWRERAEVAKQHDEIWKKGVETLHVLMDRQRITSDLARLKAALEVIDGSLTVESDMEINLGYFYKLEKFNHIRLRQLSQLGAPPPPDGSPFKAVPISLRATGSYEQLMNFVRSLETGPRILTIRTFSLSRSDPKNSTMSLDLTVDLLGKK